MDEDAKTRRPFWQFSLRELLLLMLAAGAFLGWGTVLYQRYQQFVPTPFFSGRTDWHEDIAAILQEIGTDKTRANRPTVTHSEGQSAVRRTEIYRVDLGTASSGEFFSKLLAHVREKLAEEECKAHGGASGTGGYQVTILGYGRDRVVGSIEICLSTKTGSETSLIITTHEERSLHSGMGFGLTTGD